MTSDSEKIVSLPARAKGKGVKRQSGSPRYPRIQEAEQVERHLVEVDGAVRRLYDVMGLTRDRVSSALSAAEQALGMAHSANLAERIALLGAPASMAYITGHLVNLVGSDPHDDIPEPEIYYQAMEDDISSLAPSRYAIEAGCRSIRRTLRFRPKIAEVYEAVQAAESEFKQRVRLLESLPNRIAEARNVLSDMDERAQVRSEKRSAIFAAIDAGEPWIEIAQRYGREWDLLEEVRRTVSMKAKSFTDPQERRASLQTVGLDYRTLDEINAEIQARQKAEEADAKARMARSRRWHEMRHGKSLSAKRAREIEYRLMTGEPLDGLDEAEIQPVLQDLVDCGFKHLTDGDCWLTDEGRRAAEIRKKLIAGETPQGFDQSEIIAVRRRLIDFGAWPNQEA